MATCLLLSYFPVKLFQKTQSESISNHWRGFGIASMILGYDIFNLTNWAYKLVYTISFIFPPISSWILVAFSIDRLIVVSNTKWFSFIKSKQFQYWVVAGIFTINLVIYSPSVFYVSSKNLTTANSTAAQVCILDFFASYQL